MGKKVKEDKKAPPEDVFDTILVESRQAATVVLMLNSPEEDVQSKACEAIYKFVAKCDENKKTLLDLDSIDPLLRLVQGEDKTVRRNACMALGVMCAHPDVRKLLRKRDDSIAAFVNLLQPEEDTVVHEFSTLALSYLATEFSTKVSIFENNGIEPLVKCLSSTDPDVQKNAIEALAQMLLDYQTRGAVREYEGLQPMLDLLKSEYAIIQKLSLLSLDRASQDAENRASLRELEAISHLINFLAHPEWNDLHVMAVMVLSNLLEDVESLEQVKETGGLKRLVAIITDQPPVEEESKGGKADKKAGSRAGKKSAKGEAKKVIEEKDEQSPGGNSIIPTLPDVKMSAARAIARSARNVENRKILHEQEAEKMLIHLLSHESVDVQSAAAQALGIMCENLISRDSIREWEGLAPLIRLLNSESGDVKESVTLALANLTTANSTNCNEMMNLNGLDPLIQLLADSREEAVANTASVLTNLAQEEVLRIECLNRAVVSSLIDPLKTSNTNVQSKAALALAAFVCDADARTELRVSGGVEPLIVLLHSGNDEVRRNTSWAITVCGVDEPTATEICKLGGLEVLQQIQMSSTRRSPFTDAALERLLDSNLSAKYALSGHLGSGNLIEDGFFDAGQLKPGSKFLSLEDFCKQEMNDKRPTLLINSKQEKVEVKESPPPPPSSEPDSETDPQQSPGHGNRRLSWKSILKKKPSPPPRQEDNDALKADSSKTSVSGKSSRTGRETKSREEVNEPMSPSEQEAEPEHENRHKKSAPPKRLSWKTIIKKKRTKAQREREEKQKEEEIQAQLAKEAEAQAAEENKPFTTPEDPALYKYMEDVMDKIQPLPTTRLQVVALAEYVAEKMGGAIAKGQVTNFSWELALSQIKFELKSNVVPIGKIKAGIHVHRALLFKTLADRIAVGCSLTRGEYNRAWNEVMLPEEDEVAGAARYPPKPYIVDLIHKPGKLLPVNTPEAVSYQKL
ncbi:armadillo repeat-containing protein 3-like isoform X1 [Haliotis cracherodii]|uniref:armadillo repeat-containing protein 3-like isoform X1 n=1 Tax=Haliotis cracherodii TaxID=6455 RepID=UPI0039E7DC6A